MPKIERPAYAIRRVITNPDTPYESEKFELLGRAAIFGTKLRKYFVTKKAAEEHADEVLKNLRAHGTQASELTDVQRSEAVQAFEILSGKSDLLTAVRFFVNHAPKSEKITARKAVEGFLVTRGVTPQEFGSRLKWRPVQHREKIFGSYSNRHRLSLTSNLRHFCNAFGKEPIHSLSLRQGDIQAYLIKHYSNPQTLRNHRVTLHSLFEWCIEQGYCRENPAKSWTAQRDRMRRYSKGRKPGIITPIQLGSLLTTAQALDFEMLPYLTLGAFSGMRPEELQRITWENIKTKIIHVPAEVTAS